MASREVLIHQQEAIGEFYEPDDEWRRLIGAGRERDAVAYVRSQSDGNLFSGEQRGKTVFEHALIKAFRGEMDALECIRYGSFSRYETPTRSSH